MDKLKRFLFIEKFNIILTRITKLIEKQSSISNLYDYNFRQSVFDEWDLQELIEKSTIKLLCKRLFSDIYFESDSGILEVEHIKPSFLREYLYIIFCEEFPQDIYFKIFTADARKYFENLLDNLDIKITSKQFREIILSNDRNLKTYFRILQSNMENN